jgi:alkylation response protein AidB-like acyl-CoA dehydrogenase
MDLAHTVGFAIVIGLVFVAAFYRLTRFAWTVTIGSALVILSLFGMLSGLFFLFSWVIFLLAAAFAHFPEWRQHVLLKPALSRLKKQLPTISATEQAAIDAGDTWWEKELFSGHPDWKKLYEMPAPTLSAEEQHFLDNQVETLCGMLNDWQTYFVEHDLPRPVWDYLKQEKFFGLVIPKQFGGLGFSAVAHSTIVMKIASRCLSAAVNTMVPNSLGPGELLLHYGTDEQKKYYLPRLATGQEIPCFALTGPDAASDAGAIPDKGIVCRGTYEGKETLGIRLTWDKRYITLAPIATVLGLAVQLYDPEHLLGDKEQVGITLCLIPTSHPGVEIGSRHLPLYHAFMNGPTRGTDVFIPLDWIIGGVDMAGQGWRMLMECLSIGRSISLPALATATARMTYRFTGAYARIRKQFNTPIAYFEGIEEKLGYIGGYMYLMESTRLMTAGALDQQINPSIVSAIAKYHLTELSRKAIEHALDVHAGHMIQAGPRNLLANTYIATPISITVEGANILTRNLIIFGQGAIRCHPYLLREVALLAAPNTDIAALDNVLMEHIGFLVGNAIRAFGYGLSGGLLIQANEKSSRIKKQIRQLTRMSTALALLADVSLILLGGSLKRRERLSARLGDILSHLYLASCVLKYYYDHKRPASDVDYVDWSLQYCLQQIQVAIDEITSNFPYKWLGKLLRWLIFPYGTAYKKPSDKLHKKLVTSMTALNDLRDRLTQYCYISHAPDDLSSRLETALMQIETIEPLQQKLHKAVQSKNIPAHASFEEKVHLAQQADIITPDEARQLNKFEVLRREIIKVNEFTFDFKTVID